jgi:hypothetical protein
MLNGNPVFDRSEMFNFFKRAGEICKERDIYFEIAIYGGSSLMMQSSLMDIRRATEDVDYVPLVDSQDDEINRILKKVSDEFGYEDRVFRDDVKMLISDEPDYDFFAEYPEGMGNFRVFMTSPEYLMAMKAMAMRSGFISNDPIDFFHLARELDISTLDEVLEVIGKYFPSNNVPRSYQLTIQDLLEYKDDLGDGEMDEDRVRYLSR